MGWPTNAPLPKAEPVFGHSFTNPSKVPSTVHVFIERTPGESDVAWWPAKYDAELHGKKVKGVYTLYRLCDGKVYWQVQHRTLGGMMELWVDTPWGRQAGVELLPEESVPTCKRCVVALNAFLYRRARDMLKRLEL